MRHYFQVSVSTKLGKALKDEIGKAEVISDNIVAECEKYGIKSYLRNRGVYVGDPVGFFFDGDPNKNENPFISECEWIEWDGRHDGLWRPNRGADMKLGTQKVIAWMNQIGCVTNSKFYEVIGMLPQSADFFIVEYEGHVYFTIPHQLVHDSKYKFKREMKEIILSKFLRVLEVLER